METKHNIGDSVWMLYKDKIHQVKIFGIHPTQDSDREITWSVQTREEVEKWKNLRFLEREKTYIDKLESQLFKTRQELIDSL